MSLVRVLFVFLLECGVTLDDSDYVSWIDNVTFDFAVVVAAARLNNFLARKHELCRTLVFTLSRSPLCESLLIAGFTSIVTR